MQVILELPPEVEAQASAQARTRGLDLPAYILSLVERAAQPPPRPEPKKLSRQEFRDALDGMAEFSDKIPPLPGETFSREMICQDHD